MKPEENANEILLEIVLEKLKPCIIFVIFFLFLYICNIIQLFLLSHINIYTISEKKKCG